MPLSMCRSGPSNVGPFGMPMRDTCKQQGVLDSRRFRRLRPLSIFEISIFEISIFEISIFEISDAEHATAEPDIRSITGRTRAAIPSRHAAEKRSAAMSHRRQLWK